MTVFFAEPLCRSPRLRPAAAIPGATDARCGDCAVPGADPDPVARLYWAMQQVLAGGRQLERLLAAMDRCLQSVRQGATAGMAAPAPLPGSALLPDLIEARRTALAELRAAAQAVGSGPAARAGLPDTLWQRVGEVIEQIDQGGRRLATLAGTRVLPLQEAPVDGPRGWPALEAALARAESMLAGLAGLAACCEARRRHRGPVPVARSAVD